MSRRRIARVGTSPGRRAWWALGTAAVLVMATGSVVSLTASRSSAPTAACPPGYQRVVLGTDPDSGARIDADAGDSDAGPARTGCLNVKHPESYDDFSRVASLGAAHDSTTSAGLRYGAHAAAVATARRLAAHQGHGTWRPAAAGPLIANSPAYPQTSGEGFTNLSGRINSFAWDPKRQILYATVGQGGVWKSRDLGAHWVSIGDGLPSQPVGSVAYTPAGGSRGTIVVVTGNDEFGGGTGSYGMGVWYTRNGGHTWKHSHGVPSDALGFRAAVDPTHHRTLYAATSAGLFRSTNAGRKFVNVDLPTGYTDGNPANKPLTPNCTGKFTAPRCFLANMVTDVTVQGRANAKTPHAKPGAVMAVVGWRAGNKQNVNGGYVESPNNGIYVSRHGKRGTFRRVDTSGSLGDQSQIGRTELGAATGTDQNHAVVYAEVADAQAFQNSDEFGIDVPAAPTGSNTYFRGIYVSTNWGKTWSQLASATQIDGDPTTGSSLSGVGCAAQSYCPGVQAWYNEWIQPDPTQTDSNGIPSRLLFGLEEVWANAPIPPTPLDGSAPVRFKVVGRYFGGTTCQFLSTGIPFCPTNGADQSKTTLHPDQHAAIFIPDGHGGVTVFAGSDGGAYRQHLAAGQNFTSAGWGPGLQQGFNTLMPYDAAIANDGTIVAGLQDNGEEKIANGKSNEIFDGDGFYTAIDPADSKTIYEEYAYGQMNVSTDGGTTWTEIHASDAGSMFAMPFSMDPTDSNHLIAGGGTDPNSTSTDEYVEETTNGPTTTEPGTGPALPTDWVNVFDLGSSGGAPNTISATATRGAASYVGYCGTCEVLNAKPFHSGIATNVGGSSPGAKASKQGWHFAKADGLPQRMVSSIAIDPSDPRTVYVTLADYSRRWLPTGVLGENTSRIGEGHVFVSHDAGDHFRNLSKNLPDAPANAVVLHKRRLVVGTDVGVYVSKPLKPHTRMKWHPLGRALPLGLQVIGLCAKPDDPRVLVAATHGRGVYLYKFPRKHH